MKKRISFLLWLNLLAWGNGNAQGFLDQKGAWIKTQVKQIALWEIYIKDAEKGYAIAKQGLTTIGNVKNGDFHLHLDHFNGLMNATPEIKTYCKVLEILSLQADIKSLYPKTNDTYINSVFTHLIDGGTEDVDQLNKLLAAGNYKMTDADRIKNIDKLHGDMLDKYAFAKSFSNDIKILSLQQLKEKNEVKTSRLLNNVKMP